MSNPKEPVLLIQGVLAERFFDELKKRSTDQVFLMEGRPTLEAATRGCRQLLKRRITPTLISDNMAGVLFYKNLVKEVWMAYQDTDQEGAVCDSGALILGVLAKRHVIPVKLFPAQRKTSFLGRPEQLLCFQGTRLAPKGIKAYVPLVEWVPGKYISEIH